MSRVLVVGGASPLGSAIGTAVSAAGHDAVGTSRSGRDGTIALDIADARASRDVLSDERPDAVVFLARPDLKPDDDATLEAAVAAARRFAEECRDAGVARLVFTSSASVYGTALGAPLAEEDPTPAPSEYAQMKLRTEWAFRDVATNGSLSLVILRIFNIFGPGFASSLVNRLHVAAAGAAPPQVFPTDDFVRDYVHCDDVADVVVTALGVEARTEILNVGTGVGVGNLELLRLVPRTAWVDAGELSKPSFTVADTRRLRAVLGTVPRVRVADYLGAPAEGAATQCPGSHT